jgi:demethoxyubiquinone hydroxylase (CLK1/Coq7/Cat5 family)
LYKRLHHERLVHILQCAYSGELAAGYAYRGHWKSVKNRAERAKIQQIENEEWVHRERVGEMLAELGAAPAAIREARMWVIGRVIGAACHVTGWFFPMYFAGRLESSNVEEYESAAYHAAKLGLAEFESDLRVMARVEKEHEMFFLGVVSGHRLLPLARAVFKWGEPAPPAASEAEPAVPSHKPQLF